MSPGPSAAARASAPRPPWPTAPARRASPRPHADTVGKFPREVEGRDSGRMGCPAERTAPIRPRPGSGSRRAVHARCLPPAGPGAGLTALPHPAPASSPFESDRFPLAAWRSSPRLPGPLDPGRRRLRGTGTPGARSRGQSPPGTPLDGAPGWNGAGDPRPFRSRSPPRPSGAGPMASEVRGPRPVVAPAPRLPGPLASWSLCASGPGPLGPLAPRIGGTWGPWFVGLLRHGSRGSRPVDASRPRRFGSNGAAIAPWTLGPWASPDHRPLPSSGPSDRRPLEPQALEPPGPSADTLGRGSLPMDVDRLATGEGRDGEDDQRLNYGGRARQAREPHAPDRHGSASEREPGHARRETGRTARRWRRSCSARPRPRHDHPDAQRGSRFPAGRRQTGRCKPRAGEHDRQGGPIRRRARAVEGDYDFIILDTSPTRSVLTIDVLVYRGRGPGPDRAGAVLALGAGPAPGRDRGRAVTSATPALRIAGLVLTRTRNDGVSRDVETQLRATFGGLVCRGDHPDLSQGGGGARPVPRVLDTPPLDRRKGFQALVAEILSHGRATQRSWRRSRAG